jgi:hypothetical protein
MSRRSSRYVVVAALLLATLAGCDRFRSRCDNQGGVVQQQRDVGGEAKARVCKVNGDIVDIAPALMRPRAVGVHG